VIVNIALWEIFLMKKPEVGVVFLVMAIFLIWAYRAYFASVFTCNARSCASRG